MATTRKGAKKPVQTKAGVRKPGFRAPRPLAKGIAVKGRLRRDHP